MIYHGTVFLCISYILKQLLFSHSVVSGSLRRHGLQQDRLPNPSAFPVVCSNSWALSWWCHPIISSSVIQLSCLQSFPALGFFLMSWLFTLGGHNTGALASTSVLPMNIPDWFPLGLTGLISLLSKGLSRVFSSTTIWRHQIFGAQSFFYCPDLMTTGKTIALTIRTFVSKVISLLFNTLSQSVQFSCSVVDDSLRPPWITAYQASLSIINSRSLLKLMSIESVMPSSHLIICCPLLLLPPMPPSIRVFSNETTLCMSWPKYWSFSFNINPSNEHPGTDLL